MEGTITTIGIIAGVSALFGYTLKLVLPRLLSKIDEKDDDLRKLTIAFTDVQNHKTTEMTNALKELTRSNEKHSIAVEAQTKVFSIILNKLELK